MKRRTKSYEGSRPIATGSLTREVGGFLLDRESQNFVEGNVIPAGTLARRNENTRKVLIVKTAKVKAIDAEDAKIVTLESDAFLAPIFAVGEKVLKTVTGVSAYSDAPSIAAISDNDSGYVVTLSNSIAGLAVGDILVQVVSVDSVPVSAGVITADNSNKIYMITPGLDIVAGDKLYKGEVGSSSLVSEAATVSSYDKVSGKLVTAAAISGCAAGDTLTKVFADATTPTKAVTTQKVANTIKANCVVVEETLVREDGNETIVDVCADTMSYAIYERRILPVEDAQKDATGTYLAENPHIRFTSML